MKNQTEMVQEVYEGLNRNDIPFALKNVDAQIVRIEFEGTPHAGVFRGMDEVKAHFLKGRETWAEGSCTPERFTVEGDKVIAFVFVRVRLKNKTEWLEGHTADVFTFKDDKIIEFRTFAESKQAIEWVRRNHE